MKKEAVPMHWLKLGRLAIVLTLLTGCLTACNYRDYFQNYSGYDYGSRPDEKKAAPNILRAQSLRSDPGQHENKRLIYSPELSKQVSNMPGVYTGLVFLTDRNAYVGIMTDLTATGTRSSGDRSVEQNNIGAAGGTAYAGSGIPEDSSLAENDTMTGMDALGGGITAGVANDARSIPPADENMIANVYNFYFTHKDPADISPRLRQSITAKILKAEPEIKNVFISANREYVNQLIEFAKQSWIGQPLSPLIPEFNRLVRYVFAGGKEIPIPLYELRYVQRAQNPGATPSGNTLTPADGGQ